MASESGCALTFSLVSVVEDVLKQHVNTRSTGFDLATKAGVLASRRYEAATWLRKIVGVVTARDLPADPSWEEFRLGLRSGHILCNVVNQIQPGVVPKVVEAPQQAALISDGAALSPYQYFENVRNFLVAMQEMRLPTFDASDLEEGGITARVVNSVLALKSYYEWKQSGGNGVWNFDGIKTTFGSLTRAVLKDKFPEEVPMLVESLLAKVVEELHNRIVSQTPNAKFAAVKEELGRDVKPSVAPPKESS